MVATAVFFRPPRESERVTTTRQNPQNCTPAVLVIFFGGGGWGGGGGGPWSVAAGEQSPAEGGRCASSQMADRYRLSFANMWTLMAKGFLEASFFLQQSPRSRFQPLAKMDRAAWPTPRLVSATGDAMHDVCQEARASGGLP